MHAVASCVDYITGFTATLGIAQALLARDLGRGGAAVRTSLAMGAQLVQFPFMIDHDGVTQGAEPSGQGVNVSSPRSGPSSSQNSLSRSPGL